MRNGVWFKSLDNIERGIIKITINILDKVESIFLGVIIVNILKKIKDGTKSEFTRLCETIGPVLAQRYSDLALSWGSIGAINWKYCLSYIKYLTLIAYNSSSN